LLFVSSDHDQNGFDQYFSEMTFCAMPFEERDAKADISKRLQIKGIPSLLIFGPRSAEKGDRPLINGNLRGIFETGDYISEFPYKPKPYGDLNKSTDDINTCKCLIVFHEAGDDAEHEDIQETLKMVAENYAGTDGVKFYWATSPTGLSKTVRTALKLGAIGDKPLMVLLDIPDQGAFYVSDATEITMEVVSDFVKSNGGGERQQL
jgi:nucleoredoxin